MNHKTYSTELWVGKTYFRLTWDGKASFSTQALYKDRWVEIECFDNHDYDNAKDALSFALDKVFQLKPTN